MKYREVKSFSRKLRNTPTPSEQLLWNKIRDRQLDGFRFLRQHPLIYDRQGNDLRFFIPDFYCPAAKLIIELDGSIHLRQKEYDEWREAILIQKGLTVLRFSNDALSDMEEVLRTIRDVLNKSYRIPPPSPKGGGQGVGSKP